MSKMKLIIIVLSLSVFGLLTALIDSGDNISAIIPPKQLTIQAANMAQNVLAIKDDNTSLLREISTAKDLLNNSGPLKFEEKSTRYKNSKGQYYYVKTLDKEEIALAIFDTKTGQIFERRYWLSYDEIEQARKLRKLYVSNDGALPKFTPENTNDVFSVYVNWWNDHNSDLSIAGPGIDPNRYIVLANKFLMDNDNLAYPEDRTGAKYSDIVYVPYSQFIDNNQLTQAGREYLNRSVNSAFQELRSLGVESHAYPGKLVVNTIQPDFVKNLFLTEQTDPKLIFGSDDGGLGLANRVLQRLGANGDTTFRYTVSKTGASGLGQIMPGTYNSIRKAYPNANLIKDTDIGRVDIVNGIKATILTLDDHFATVVGRAVTNSQKNILANKTDGEKESIYAAIYNGGPGKYIPSTGTISTKVRETVDFVKKYKLISLLGLFD